MKKFALIALLAIIGCDNSPKSEESENIQWAKATLPVDAKIIEDKGMKRVGAGGCHGWLIVEIPVQEKNRKYLYHWWLGSHSEFASSFAEIKDD